MKFRIRFADQLVGLLIIAALGILVFSIFMVGKRHRWFAKDQTYRTHFESASGLSANMPVQYKGFTIGNVKAFDLTGDDKVEVSFTIYDTYLDRVREGSLVEIRINPIGIGGSQFLFYPGIRRDPLEGDFIPSVNSDAGKDALEKGLVLIPVYDDSITVITTRVNTLLQNINGVVTQLRDAFRGTDTETSLGRTVSGLEGTARSASALAENAESALKPVFGNIEQLTDDMRSVIRDLKTVTAELSNPDSLVLTVLDTGGAVYTNLERSLKSLSGTLESVEATAVTFPAQMPQVAALISELRSTLEAAEDVIIALRNNPLLKKGVPNRVQPGAGGISPRDVAF
ncbi:MAG: MlaD family protein [Treponema sp.]|jgi:phospholipid/cholesterol/gamma-HCH transport system substrate-binding protein|nr:MlaD family protein [Treponema sp.]